MEFLVTFSPFFLKFHFIGYLCHFHNCLKIRFCFGYYYINVEVVDFKIMQMLF